MNGAMAAVGCSRAWRLAARPELRRLPVLSTIAEFPDTCLPAGSRRRGGQNNQVCRSPVFPAWSRATRLLQKTTFCRDIPRKHRLFASKNSRCRVGICPHSAVIFVCRIKIRKYRIWAIHSGLIAVAWPIGRVSKENKRPEPARPMATRPARPGMPDEIQ